MTTLYSIFSPPEQFLHSVVMSSLIQYTRTKRKDKTYMLKRKKDPKEMKRTQNAASSFVSFFSFFSEWVPYLQSSMLSVTDTELTGTVRWIAEEDMITQPSKETCWLRRSIFSFLYQSAVFIRLRFILGLLHPYHPSHVTPGAFKKINEREHS